MTIAVVVGVLAGAPSAWATPTVTLVADCHNPTDAYAFDASVSGFPANLPFDAVLHYSDVDHSFIGLLSTGATGSVGPVSFGDNSPLGVVRATVTATIDGALRTFTASLRNPCDPQPTLENAMCGDGNYRMYGFAQIGECDEYVMRLQDARTVPRLRLSPVCEGPGSSGFRVLVLGFPPGTPVEVLLSAGGQSLKTESKSNRFGAVGPSTITLPTLLSEVTATVTGGGRRLTATLQNPCAP